MSEEKKRIMEQRSQINIDYGQQVKDRISKRNDEFRISTESKKQSIIEKDEHKKKLITGKKQLVIELADHKRESHDSLIRKRKFIAEKLMDDKKYSIHENIQRRKQQLQDFEKQAEEEKLHRQQESEYKS